MEFASSATQAAATPEAVVAQVRRQLSLDLIESAGDQRHQVDRIVETTVRELWSGRVKTFVPVLALREARDYLREQRSTAPVIQPRLIASAEQPATSPAVRDAMPVADDVYPLQDDDVLRF
jgi:hypothetical protein